MVEGYGGASVRTVCESAPHLRTLIVSLTQSQSQTRDTDTVHAAHQNTFTLKQTDQDLEQVLKETAI